jgi:hypothetical protein
VSSEPAVERVRPPLLSRALATVIAAVGLLLLAGSMVDQHPDLGALLTGCVFLVGGSGLALARGECTEARITYWNVRRYRVPAESVSAVEVEKRGWATTFPTVVVYRHDGRPLVLRAVQDYRSTNGWSRQAKRAERWRITLGLPRA